MSNSLWSHGLQHTRLLCPSPSPRVAQSHVHVVSDAIHPSYPMLFPSLPAFKSFPASKSFPMSHLCMEKEMETHSSILDGEFHGQRSLAGYSPWGWKELDTTEQLTCISLVSGGQSVGASASASVLPINIQGWFPLGLTVLILLSKRLSIVFSSTTVQKDQFFSTQTS